MPRYSPDPVEYRGANSVVFRALPPRGWPVAALIPRLLHQQELIDRSYIYDATKNTLLEQNKASGIQWSKNYDSESTENVIDIE